VAAEAALKDVLPGLGAELVAVSHQTVGLEEFQQKYFKGKIYLDPAKAFYHALGGVMAKEADLVDPVVKQAGKAAYKILKRNDPSYTLSSDGEGALLGGSVVLSRQGVPLFVHKESKFGDVADPADLQQACEQAAAASKL